MPNAPCVFRLDGQRALVTGGTSGIGEATARLFLQAGARVVVAARGQKRWAEAVEALPSHGEVHFIRTDVRDEGAVRRTIGETVEILGGLDILVNSAGVIDRTPLHDLALPVWEEMLAPNLTGVYLASRHALPHLQQSRGAVVNVASYLAFRAGSARTVAYNAAKAGVVALTRTMAVAYGPDGVRVNAVCPAFIPTELNRSLWESFDDEQWRRIVETYPLRRVGIPEDVAYAILFLASKEAAWITGTCLLVDGGLTAK